MGNENSQPSGLIIEEKAITSDNFWTIHSATYGSDLVKRVTVFQGILCHKNKQSALEKFAKNLMIHRHPNILKYIGSWRVNDQFHLATEEVFTLQQALPQQTPLQICIGIHSILNAIQFLHEKALSSHNNICQASVFITPEGHWKLGGTEYLCRFSDLSARFLADSREGRYERGILPGEENRVPQPPSAIDIYAFCVLITEIFGKQVEDDVPGMQDFINICKEYMNSPDSYGHLSLDSFLNHSFFNHDFISIHSFLTELPLKSESEKQMFFRDLCPKLNGFNENIVANQLGSLLLSRIVLLDSTAQQCLLPHVLVPRVGDKKDCLFSEKTFQKYIAPKLLSMFYVRDIQVRLTLLMYFSAYCSMFNTAELHSNILPELLVGVKDTNNELVAATLKALADLVPILGAAKVIGGKRAKNFADGRPKMVRQVKGIIKKPSKSPPKNTEVYPEEKEIFLTERPSPDGGEAQSEFIASEDEVEQWDAWDSLTPQVSPSENVEELENDIVEEKPLITLNPEPLASKVVVPPPDSLDVYEVKAQIVRKSSIDDVDFFRDMEPVISKTSILEIAPKNHESSTSNEEKSKFAINSSETEPEGWGEELEWADVIDS
ncbi:unnamed protein product [Nezara viridula]|uniref:Protein kinase domain-containing protein n=1 Tax=Nezara viridula TaxID=85310 RepID=A0A9P0HH74_NEZVI|nr:unnamed protein product [Nezara viridula]